jgi:hypothetical protein
LSKLLEKYRTSTEDPPTRNLSRLKWWSQVWGWQSRLAVRDAEIEAAKRHEALRQAEAQACANAPLMTQVGQGALGIVALALDRYVDRASGDLRAPVPLHTLPGLMTSGAQLIQLSAGQPTSVVGTGERTLEDILRIAPDETRARILQGLRALHEFQERTDTR